MHFPEKDKIFLELDKLLPLPVKIIAGVSGGPDSAMTFALLQEYYAHKGWDHELLIIAHFHHGQRKESDKELQQIFKQYKHHHIYYNTDKPKMGQKETALRRLRMSFFHEVCEKEKAVYLALGHNLDDRIETSFMNLLRGTSLKGLSNMSVCDYRDGLFHLRPLIGLQKRYIQELCDTNNLPYSLDATNKNSSLTIRNALRNDIFPQMALLSPQNRWYESRSLIYTQIEGNASDKSSDHIRIYPRHPHEKWGAHFCYEISFGFLNKNDEYTETDRMFIFQQLGIYKNVGQKTLAEWVRFSNTSEDGYKFLAGVYFFVAHRKIYAIKAPANFREREDDATIRVTKSGIKIAFDGQKLLTQPLRVGGEIRYVKPGDVYKGKRLKKRMINQKIPLFRRNSIPVVVKKGAVIDVINLAQKYRY